VYLSGLILALPGHPVVTRSGAGVSFLDQVLGAKRGRHGIAVLALGVVLIGLGWNPVTPPVRAAAPARG